MRKSMLYIFCKIAVVVCFISITSCSKVVTLSAMRPAPITVPSHIKTLLVVDRTEFNKKAVGIIEGILTGEGVYEDKNGIQDVINSFQQTILTSPRFEIKRASERLKGNNLLGTFPDPIAWSQISNLCTQYAADGIVAVEVFDSNFILTNGKRNVKKQIKDSNGQTKEVEVLEFYAEGVATVKIGIRLYDPKAKNIVDQQMFSKANTWQAGGATVKDAIAALISKTEATRYVSELTGSTYAQKIAPMPIRISRTFFGSPKKSPYMISGVRQALVNEWVQAIESWKGGLGNSNSKTAGRLCYNIAIAYEVLGDLNLAKEWANRSYVTYGNKQAREYSSMLNYRIKNENLVNQQLN